MKFIKENWKMITVILLIVILFPSIILVASNKKLLSYNTAIAIIGYGGSILGGFLTLYGVWWTIKDHETKRREDLSIQYMPLMVCEEFNTTMNNIENNILDAISTSLYSTFKEGIPKNYLKEIKIVLKIGNFGRGEAIVTNIKTALAVYPSEDDNFINESHDNPLNQNNIIIAPSQSKNINLIFSFDTRKPIPKKMIFAINLTYFSHFDNNEITMNSSLSIKIDKNRFIKYGDIKLDLFSTENQY